MTKLLYFAVITVVTLSACSKKSDTAPKTDDNTVSIGGIVYNTVVIGGQTWTLTNYNGPGGVFNNSSTFSPGKLYSFNEAVAIPLPAGWRVPTTADFNKLALLAGATVAVDGHINYTPVNVFSLMSTSNWPSGQGTNLLGFNAVPAGYYAMNYFGLGTDAIFWCSTTSADPIPQTFYIEQLATHAPAAGLNDLDPTIGASVRFVR